MDACSIYQSVHLFMRILEYIKLSSPGLVPMMVLTLNLFSIVAFQLSSVKGKWFPALPGHIVFCGV